MIRAYNSCMTKTPAPARITVNLRSGTRGDIDAMPDDGLSTTDLVNRSLSLYCYLSKFTRDGELRLDLDPDGSGRHVSIKFL